MRTPGAIDRAGRMGVLLGFLVLLLSMVLPDVPGEVVLLGLGGLFLGTFGPYLYNLTRLRDRRQDRALLAMELADLLEAGLPLAEALEAEAQCLQSDPKTRWTSMAVAAEQLSLGLKRGQSLDQAVAATRAFPQAWTALLSQIPESQLPQVLRRLSRLEEASPDLNQPTQAVVTLVVVGAVALFVATYILPTFVALFEGMNLSLPWPTRVVVTVCRLVRNPVVQVPLGLVFLLLVVATRPTRSPLSLGASSALGLLGQHVGQEFMSWLPGWRQALSLSEQALAADTMACALRTGLPTPRVLELAAQTSRTRRYRLAFQQLSGEAARGQGLAQGFEKWPGLFSAPLRWAVRQSEAEGQAETLAACSHYLTQEYRRALRRLVVLGGAALLLLGGLAMGMVAVGCMTPLLELTRGMQEGADVF